ncbi:MAG TPA: hypothetical protein PKM25_17615, partial [Candidatus Ozemobacteraceae bacterium]|nr:hypothetical protein [Candidatus Ozemobacteraceae bacterium]
EEHSGWLSFRNHPLVRATILRSFYIPLYKDAGHEYEVWFEAFARETVSRFEGKAFHEFLKSFADENSSEGGPFPREMTRRLETMPEVLNLRNTHIREWVQKSIHSSSLITIEAALRLAFCLGFHDETVAGITKHGYRLFSSGKFGLIQTICRRYLDTDRPIPSQVFVIAARTAARENRFDDAISILDRGKERFENLDDAELDFGELALASGNILRINGRLTEAMAELALARECFAAARDLRRTAAADNALGNLMIMRSRPEAARRYYLSALTAVRTGGLRDAQASVLGNLGLVENDLGNVKRGVLYLSRAVSLHSMLGNSWNESVAALSLAKMQLSMGRMTKALRLFKDVHSVRSRIGHLSGMYEAAAFLGWTCDLLGKPGAAEAWWNLIPPDVSGEPRIQYIVDTLRAMRLLFHGKISDALASYHSILDMLQARESSCSERGDIFFGIGACLTLLQHPEAPGMLSEAVGQMAGSPHRIQACHLRVFSALMYPDLFSGLPYLDDMRNYPASNCF